MTNSEKQCAALADARTRAESERLGAQRVRQEKREAFYDGAQYLYNVHFTSMHPFPAREVMDAATALYPEPLELRTVTILGTKYRANGEQIEVLTGKDWVRAVAITPGYIRTLNELLDNPYEATK